ncbi:NAD(P)-dependent alcohol dehydrogenase [Hydrogenophaga sp.]|uniref:NAD(P)-dependent alcohol dehydrogenase n=1 Tax=Hydrogenophaga sp. TaxID=1904254 RepID=UPI002603C9B2|nr:NAD(P)-dependent alcohol dehydrogenase [Hydrogenophaga sp.]
MELPVPEPGPGQVRIRIGGAGVCHSDLHLLESGREGGASMFTLGHENAGWVDALGAGVTDFKEGDAVAVYGKWGCGQCAACLRSCENYCTSVLPNRPALFGGAGVDGGMAEYMVVPSSRHLVLLKHLKPSMAAPLTDAALTPYHAIKRARHVLSPGVSVAVIGVGGLGHMAVQILKAITACKIIALDVDDEKLNLALKAGAHTVLNCRGMASVELIEGASCGLVLDCVGSHESMKTALALTGVDGHLMVLGLAGGVLPFSKSAVPWGATLSFPYWGSRAELQEVICLAESGLIQPHVTFHPLSAGGAVISDLQEGRVLGRAVLVP